MRVVAALKTAVLDHESVVKRKKMRWLGSGRAT